MQLSEQAFQTPFPPQLLIASLLPPRPRAASVLRRPRASVAQSNLRGKSSQDRSVTCEEASTRVAIWSH